MRGKFVYFVYVYATFAILLACSVRTGVNPAKERVRAALRTPSTTVAVRGKSVHRLLQASLLTAGKHRRSLQCVSDALLESLIEGDDDRDVSLVTAGTAPTAVTPGSWRVVPFDSDEGRHIATLADRAFKGERVELGFALVRCAPARLLVGDVCAERPLATLGGIETHEGKPAPGNHTCNCEAAGLGFADLSHPGFCVREGLLVETKRDPCTGMCFFGGG